MEIIPAILPKDFYEIENKVEQIKGLVEIVQVDICDGKFVPSFTWPYKKHDINYEEILREERGMPYWEDVNYEFDLMVSEPNLTDWITAGATRIIVHAESVNSLESIVSQYASVVELGIALNVDTEIDVIAPYVDRIAFVQCMGISKIGFQGQNFNEKVLEKIKSIKSRWSNLIISVDGGVSLESAKLLKEVGVSRLVAGSSIFGSGNIPEAIHNFKQI
jgi:ribulose-phosphate 3-epimerase